MFKLIGKFILNGAALWLMDTFFIQVSFADPTTILAAAAALAFINVLF